MMNKDLQKTTWQKAMYLIFPVISIGLLMTVSYTHLTLPTIA